MNGLLDDPVLLVDGQESAPCLLQSPVKGDVHFESQAVCSLQPSSWMPAEYTQTLRFQLLLAAFSWLHPAILLQEQKERRYLMDFIFWKGKFFHEHIPRWLIFF